MTPTPDNRGGDPIWDEAGGNGRQSARTLVDADVLEAVQQYRRALEQGEYPDRQKVLASFPEIADELARCLSAIEFLHQVAPQVQEGLAAAESPAAPVRPTTASVLGDYRLVRQIGHGGMGVVYEAEQISLHRRVALKVLPFASVLDPRQLRRFKKEAQAAAGLQHPNIVSIYSVGCERGVHYYAMQYIEGQTLAQVIAQLRGLAEPGVPADAGQTAAHLADGLIRDRFAANHTPGGDDSTVDFAEAAGALRAGASNESFESPFDFAPPDRGCRTSGTALRPRSDGSTNGPGRSKEFFRSAARLGIQAAEALEHAHRAGVVHRDIKPSNLMLDERGCLWITDFGLAISNADPALTATGGIVGTLRYMSPEQASGGHRGIDGRTDVYSLGVTLYELVTLRPAFGGDQRQQVLRQIAEAECLAPRRVNKAIPKDLETIILKAMAPEPRSRYATAQALADDLRRFLEDKPIRARRIGWPGRLWRWARRNPAAAGLASVAAAAIAVLAAVALGSRPDAGDPQDAAAAARTVQLETDPPGATIVFHPLDPVTGEPQPERAVRPKRRSPVRLDLEPGEYLVVAVANTPGHSFHEVYRRVPSADEGLPGAHRHLAWEAADDGSIVLRPIAIPRDSVTEGMARFEGAEQFTIGSADLSQAPPHRRRVPGFWLDAKEVSVRDYRSILPQAEAWNLYRSRKLSPGQDDALALVSYDEAAAYAERVGKRLPTEWEYEFAATRGGTQPFPWGDDAHRLAGWTYGAAGTPAWDRLDAAPPVFGLYSNVAEWTCSWPTLYPAHRKLGLPPPECASTRRIVRGGPISVMQGEPDRDEYVRGPRFRTAMLRQTWMPGLGFRCARSVAPRLEPKDFSPAAEE